MIKTKLLFLSAALCMFSLTAQPNSESMPEMNGMPPEGGHDITKQFDAVVSVNNESKTIKNETITSNEDGKNAVFVQGEKGIVNASGVKIKTEKNGSRGFYAAFGGTINASKVEVETAGEHCAAFATDMGEGTVTVENAKALTKGHGSPVIYSTGAISVKNLKGTAENSEIAVIEGKNSVVIEKSVITGGSGLDEEVSSGVMLYQSMSGDADIGTASFTAKNSTLTNKASGKNSAFFYVTNTNAVVNLDSTKLEGNSDVLILASGNNSRRGWGRSGANGGKLEFNALRENLSGEIIVDEISSLVFNLGAKSTYTGAVNAKKQGKADIIIAKNAKLVLTADSYFNKFSDDDDSFNNINSNGHKIYYNAKENPSLKGRTILLKDGGKIVPCEYDFSKLENAKASEKGMKMPPRPEMNGEKGMNPPPDGKSGDNQKGGKQMPKMEMSVLTGTLNIVSDKAMLIDNDNKATLLSVMENPGKDGKGNPPSGQPPMGGNGNMAPPSDMNGTGDMPPEMKDGQKGGKQMPKPVTFEELKKLKGKNVEVKGILEKDGTFKVFTIEAKK
ncbi:hypothetical protein [Treponema sp.]|uniref:hypothetical protein n=1 Tax=Treponema sp. TaxID=166 RepID=UPI00389115B9